MYIASVVLVLVLVLALRGFGGAYLRRLHGILQRAHEVHADHALRGAVSGKESARGRG